MKNELFDELLKSVKEAAAIERGADTAISPSLPLDDPFDR